MSLSPIELPSYSVNAFADRPKEVSIVKEKAEALRKRQPVERRTTVFVGGRGAGKSWLLKHIEHEIAEMPGLKVMAFDLARHVDTARDPVWVVIDLLTKFGTKAIGQEPRGTTPSEISLELFEQLRPHLAEQPIVFILDTVFDSSWKLLEEIETYLLGPLAIESNVLIVMAGRGPEYPWITPELRIYADFVDLDSEEHRFSLNQTKDQLKKASQITIIAEIKRFLERAVGRFAEIHRKSGGNPLANYCLALSGDAASALNVVIESMLDSIPTRDARNRVREYLEALSVLPSFSDDIILPMWAVYRGDDSIRHWTSMQARAIRGEISRWNFARWSDQQHGFVIDPAVRTIIERYLKEHDDGEVWKRLHCAARHVYREWAVTYSRAKDRWTERVAYHEGQLRDAKFDLQDCGQILGLQDDDDLVHETDLVLA